MSKLELLKQAADTRDLAVRVRRLAASFSNRADQARVKLYLEELEALTAKLEAEAAALD
jgi:hypothetical protein